VDGRAKPAHEIVLALPVFSLGALYFAVALVRGLA